MREPDELVVLWCGISSQHPAHAWSPLNADGERWCEGCNADGTTPYDPARPGYEPEQPSHSTDPLAQLDRIARDVQAHVTLHAAYGPQASRHPDPDWSCQIVWATGQPEQPTLSFYGVGTTLLYAVRHVLAQIEEAVAQLPQEDTP